MSSFYIFLMCMFLYTTKLLAEPEPRLAMTFKGGCTSIPNIMNAKTACSSAGCRATCMTDYQFATGLTNLAFVCDNGVWKASGKDWGVLPSCEPICLPECQNNGICFAPGQCNCPNNYNGPQCQFEKKPCLNNAPLPKNSRRSCNPSSCTITCATGHKFPDGSTVTNVVCKEGNWVPSRQDMKIIPDCQPTCNPLCVNGGICLSLNVCQCPKEFRGPQCQYDTEVCGVSKLGFNGGYNCSSDSDTVSCSLSCPAGIDFEFAPVFKYTCKYATGGFQPQPIPQCSFGNHQTFISVEGGGSQSYYSGIKHSSMSQYSKYKTLAHNSGQYSQNEFIQNEKHTKTVIPQSKSLNLIETLLPKSGTCFTWGGAHFKTFDGKVYSFSSECQYVLVRDSQDNTFSVSVQNVPSGRRLIIFLQNKEYILESTENGEVIFKSTKRLLPIPAQLPGLRVELSGHLIRVDLETIGVVIKWNRIKFVQVDVTQSMWNRTEGLCGRIDGNPKNDIVTKEGIVPKTVITLADSWQIKRIGGSTCDKKPSEQHACGLVDPKIADKAAEFCRRLVSNKKFTACSKIMDISLLFESCKWDYCGCIHRSRESCACDSLSVYASQCVSQGVTTLKSWRDDETCKMECPTGMVYEYCGPLIQKSCGSATFTSEDLTIKNKATCVEGCFCPDGTLFDNDKCVTKDQCPCRYRGKQFPAGSTVPKDCNTCNCQNGDWICTQATCGARCSAIGDPHYQTFDGKHYNFMGQCVYTLLKGSDYSIEAENVACSGAISEAMNIPKSSDSPSCTKMVTIKIKDCVIQLKQGNIVTINGKDINKLPVRFYGVKINMVSSLFIRVNMPNGLEIWWDGMTRVYVDAPASLQGKTKGLCGTFNLNQKDDFLTPEGDIEQSIIPFANKWKTIEKCNDMENKEVSHPCDVNIYNKETAKKLCGKLKSQLFEECHWRVDVETYYEDCLYDMCSCNGPIERCFCPIVGAYASECALQGVHIQWRYNVKECEVHCSGGQTYQVCGDSCKRSCFNIAGFYEDMEEQADEAQCRSQCVEGCNCPEGETLDENGECIPIGSCYCRHAGLDFPPQYKEVRPGTKQKDFCVCVGARWECRPASDEEIKKYPRAIDIKDKCSAANHEEFTTCEPTEPLTCKNMHYTPETTSFECHPGCKCKKGFVLDSVTKKCIRPEQCPCHHGGKSFSDGDQMQEDCNSCKCNAGKWSCEKRPCPGVCSAWGDSHFRTFDGKSYDFQGVCTYLLSKGSLDNKKDSFSIEIQNEVCGTSGVTCSKSVTMNVGSLETITFTKDKPIYNVKNLQKIKIRTAGLFVFAEVPSLGLVMQWDRGTRVYIKVNPTWKGRLKGLCGDYNDNEADDFQTPSGGITETSPRLFGDSWKLHPHCAKSQEFQDTCALHPERQTWASRQCGILKRYPFSACHSEVPPEEYLQRCERDTCACGLGGDCECLCTALAAYAHECASRGVPIHWRTQHLCPMQCDQTCTKYSPCISTCPVETCDNTMTYPQLTTLCHQDTCIEGCKMNDVCAKDFIYSNDTSKECVPRASCKPACLTLPNGQVLLEGDVMEQDDCHSCHCSRGQKICKGKPCVPTTALPTGMMEEKVKCTSGWTEWINNELPAHVKLDSGTKTKTKSSKPYSVEVETLPSVLQMNNLPGAVCVKDKIVDIECRTVSGHKSAKETGLEAECSVERGLTCRQPSSVPCPDFEIRVLCECDKPRKHTAFSQIACDISHPYYEHETDCSKYLECSPGFGTKEHPNMAERKCNEGMLFNPKTMKCDWAQVVIAFKPQCRDFETEEAYDITTPIEDLLYVYNIKTSTSSSFMRLMTCDISRPNQEHPGNCEQFYQCAPKMGPPEHPDLVLKTCGPHMFFNPISMNCDWPNSVMAIKPECGTVKSSVHPTIGPTITFIGKNESSIPECEPGKVWSDCAVDCTKVCLFYDHYLRQDGKCKSGEKCIPGCLDKSVANKYCGEGFLWRDANTCISVDDCTCRSHNGKPVKPGEVYKESKCEICQCLQNQYTCDKSTCASKKSFKPKGSTPEPMEILGQYIGVKKNSTEEFDEDGDDEIIGKSGGHRLIVETITVSPPPECNPDSYTNVLWDDELALGDEAFTASSSLNPSFIPQFSKINGRPSNTSGGSWIPAVSDTNQFIQVKLNRAEPIYGAVLQGNPLFNQYVTSYKVIYSQNGDKYDFVKKPNGQPEVFRGPIDSVTPMKQMFSVPVEAKYIRIIPMTWHDNIAIRFELIGCNEVKTTTPSPSTSRVPMKYTVVEEAFTLCKDLMGLSDAKLPNSYVTVSSNDPKYPSKYLNILGPDGWKPLTNSPREWIAVDFTALRNLTGLQTKGGSTGWVTSYSIKYSSDGHNWNTVMDDHGIERIFPANYDRNSPITNVFKRPIHAQYLKIIPNTWEKNIQMRIEPYGCFKPYDIEETEVTVGLEVESEVEDFCELCKGVDKPIHGCNCQTPMAYDGIKCESRVKCPCVVGHMRYPIGATYQTEDCKVCTCKLGGVPDCIKKECPKCKPGLSPTANCQCDCIPCPPGKRICPTSAVCIDEDLWCNSLEDCPDDELNCTLPTKPTTIHVEAVEKKCPVPSCPTGYKIMEKKPDYSKLELMNQLASDSLFARKKTSNLYMRYYKGGRDSIKDGGTKGGIKTGKSFGSTPARKSLPMPIKAASQKQDECIQWRCVSSRPPPKLMPNSDKLEEQPPCPPPKCPDKYLMKFDQDKLDEHDCPKYSCSPPARRDVVCNVTSRTFNTFDGTEYQYDICDHILARDALNNTWDVTVQKNCTNNVCVHELLISQGADKVRFRPDLTVDYNGYHYTVDQTRKIGLQTQSFAISKLGNTLFFVSTEYGFWVIYDNKGNIKVGVVGKLSGAVDGLCGYFNGKQDDDRRKPDGTQSISTEQFGDSWAHEDSHINCETRTCPISFQNQAWQICKNLRNKAFASCEFMDLEKSRARCLEEVCNCLQDGSNSASKSTVKGGACLCQALQSFVTDCMAADQSVNLQGWRTEMNCPAACPSPLIHYDCFKQCCEVSCDNLKEDQPCPPTPGVCFSGCFCPEGYVRNGENCVLPTECRDCICDGFGKPQYVSFDRRNFTFDGKCAYTVVRDKAKNGKHSFQVFINYGLCPHNPKTICTNSFHVVYGAHILHIEKSPHTLKIIVDGMNINHYPYKTKWLQLQEISGKDVNFVIPEIQLEMSTLFRNLAFNVKLPSKIHANKIEGLCGNCNGDDSDDLGKLNNPLDYAKHWRAHSHILKVLEIEEKSCAEKPLEECWPLPPEEDACLKIMDSNLFGRCHLVVDPVPYLSTCQQDICSVSKQAGVCANLEAYARECTRQGLCLDWRRNNFCPYKCDSNLEYKACGLGCQLTCENYDLYTSTPSKCAVSPTEGCFCPEGKIFINNTCIKHNECNPCDSNGHYVGDKWHKDECTECTCTLHGTTCTEQTCAKGMSCTVGYRAQQLPKLPGKCCPEFYCILEATEVSPTCEEPNKIVCGHGQIMKLEIMGNSCPKYICQCIPVEECEQIDLKSQVESLNPGMEITINSSGCCPEINYLCKPEKCPKPLVCPKHYSLKADKKKDDCCSKYECKIPPNKCIHRLEYEAAALVGEAKRLSINVESIIKNVGEKWTDGPCRSCECKDGVAACSVTKCPLLLQSEDFLIEPEGKYLQCCAKPKFIGCKYRGEIYKPEQLWKSFDDPCVSYKCNLKNDETLEKQTTVQQCKTTCKKGWKYIPSKYPKEVCCGECVQVACVVDGNEYPIGEQWSSLDHCTNFVCVEKYGNIQVESSNVTCPVISDQLERDFHLKEITVKGNCCKKIIPIACKVGSEIYHEGTKWKSEYNPCQSFICNRDTYGGLTKSERIEKCSTSCVAGSTYKASDNPKKCCGRCVQTSCIDGDLLYEPGQTWKSKDNCTQFVCNDLSDQLVISANQESCPDISKCEPENVYIKGCCKHCNITSLPQLSCISENLPPKQTVGLVQQWKKEHGKCVNTKPIDNFKQCMGNCKSGTFYNKITGKHESDCKCCQPAKYEGIIVGMTCEDGATYKHQIIVPLQCQCSPCINADDANKGSKGGRKF